MKIQSLSICVPSACLNQCEFCVAHMHKSPYTNQIEENHRFRRLYVDDYKKRLQFARDNGCNVAIITGDGEPLLNHRFLENFAEWNNSLTIPFRWIEFQTSGTKLDDGYLRFLRDTIGITTISLSLSSLDSNVNAKYNKTKQGYEIDITHLCSEIKRYDFNLRLSLNLTDYFNTLPTQYIFDNCKTLGANQITFRVLYTSPSQDTPQDKWILNHSANQTTISNIKKYIQSNGRPLEKLLFGATKYDLDDMSIVLDDDCMATEVTDTMKYLVLRPDCKLYSHWDTKGSLIF